MTDKQAYKILRGIWASAPGYHSNPYYEALDRALQALSLRIIGKKGETK